MIARIFQIPCDQTRSAHPDELAALNEYLDTEGSNIIKTAELIDGGQIIIIVYIE